MTPPGGWEWLVILFIVLLLFGGRKLPDLASSVGRSIKEFRKSTQEADEVQAHSSADREPGDARRLADDDLVFHARHAGDRRRDGRREGPADRHVRRLDPHHDDLRHRAERAADAQHVGDAQPVRGERAGDLEGETVGRDVDHDDETIFVNRTKDEIKNSPEFDDALVSDENYRSQLGSYYGPGGPAYREWEDSL